MKIQSTKDDDNKFLKILIYGEPGVGKTRFCGTAPDPIFLSAESGLLSLNKIGNFQYTQIKTFQEMIDAYEYLAVEKHNFKTIVIDSLTEIQTQCMDAILAESGKEQAQIQDWGKLGTRMVNMVRKFRDLPCNLIVTCLSETLSAEEGFEQKIVPCVQGKLKSLLAGYFDEVFLAYSTERKDADGVVSIEHALLTHGTKKYVAKDRSGMLDRKESPDFMDIYNKIYGGNN